MNTVRVPALSSLIRLSIVAVLILAGAASSPALAQQATVSLASGSAVAGGSVNLNISLSTSGGALPAGAEWTMTYPASVTSVSVVAGTSTNAAGKLLSCSSSAGSTQCIVFGLNSTVIADGILATATFNIASGALTGSAAIPVTGVVVSTGVGTGITASGVAGSIAISGVTPTFSISGTVGASGAGATVALSGTSSASTTADGSGNYTFSGLANGGYTVTPTKSGFTFTPPSQGVTISGANQTANFTATATTFSISGTVGASGAGATVALSGTSSASTTADGSGNYSFSGLANGGYTVTPTKSGFTFTPPSQAVTISGANQTANFTALGSTFSISGSVSVSGAGATVTLSGTSSASTTADGSGNYSFSGLANGGYTVTPTKSGFTFTPPNQGVTISGANQTANFTAQAPVVSISVRPGSVGLNANGMQQFTATVTGSANTAVTWTFLPAIGTLSASGLYIAPVSIASQQIVTVTATSLADATKFASATVTLNPPSVVSVSVNPGNTSVKAGATQQFTATVTGSSNTAVTWSMSLPMGTITSTGLYTAPALISTNQTFTVTATSMADSTASGSSTVVVTAALKVSGPVAVPTGNIGSAYTPSQFTATGGTGVYNWSATGLPSGLSISSSGVLRGTPAPGSQGSYNPQFMVTDSGGASDAVILPLTISANAAAPIITSVGPSPVPALNGNQTLFINGSGFQNASGLEVLLKQPSGQTALQGSQVSFLSTGQLSIQINVGTTSANWTVQVINPDGQSSNTFSFPVAPAQTTTSYALPQLVFGNGWYSALYFSNTTSSAVSIQVNFYGNDGSPLLVPLLGIGWVSSRTISLDPNSTVILEAPNYSGMSGQGWAEASLPTGVVGYGLFRQSVLGRPDQEAVVPLAPETAQAADLIYDDTKFDTAVAYLNPSNQSATLTIAVSGLDGSSLGSTQMTLAARSKQDIVLSQLLGLSGMTGKSGRAVFTVTGGAISVLGLRFGDSAFNSIPVNHRMGTQFASPVGPSSAVSSSLPQIVSGGGWDTTLYFSNTTSAPTSFTMNFIGDDGNPLNVPLLGIGTVSSQTISVNPGATVLLEAPSTTSTSAEGWVDASLPAGVIGYGVFRQTVVGEPNQEAVIPLTSESSQTSDLIYDDTLHTTSVALSNPSSQQITVTITAYGPGGSQVGSSQVMLQPRTKEAAVLRNLLGLQGVAGNRGRITFAASNGDVSVLGIRFGAIPFTSIPAFQR